MAVLVVNVIAPAASSATRSAAASHPCPVLGGAGDPTFTRNFNPYSGSKMDLTLGAIYEPLVIVTPMGGGHTYWWLAQSGTWKNNTTLDLAIRQNVKWSDGKPLTNKDVVFSLTAGLKNAAMDRVGLASADREIKSIRAVGKNHVIIKLKGTDSTFIGAQLNNVFVVPQHIFAAHTGDIDKWTNPNPVGSGAFTKITRFNGQDYVLGKNAHYWQKTGVNCVEKLSAISNDASLVQMVSGQVDDTHNFVPNVETAYEAKDPAHYHSFYATTALPIGLYFDTTKYPYSIVGFRKAISLAIDRNKVSKLGEYGYAPATSALGIEGQWPTWIDPKLKAQAKAMATFSTSAAKKAFTDAGFSYKNGKLIDPHGDPVSFHIDVIGGWSDWVASLNIITQNLQAAGVDATVKLQPDWNSWYPNAAATKVVTLLWNYGGGPTPYGFYKSHFDTASNLGSGKDQSGSGDWEHFSDVQGTQLLQQFRGTLDVKKQHQIANQLEAIFLQKLPFVPLFIGPRWSTYSTKYFTGWPTPQNAYADPIFTQFPDVTTVLTHIRKS